MTDVNQFPVPLPKDVTDPSFLPALNRILIELYNYISYSNIIKNGIHSDNILSMGATKLTGAIPQANLNVADRGWVQTCPFAVTDADTIAWTAGTFTSADGTAYSIVGGNTGNMTLKTYIYLDTAVSTTAYQTTTTATTAVGAGKVMIGIAQNGSVEATFMILQGQGGKNIDAAEIVAGSITANEIAASTITGGKIAAGTITATELSAGAITADKITAGIFTTAQLLANGDFEDWNAGTAVAPDNWILSGADSTIAREASIIKLGVYSAKMTRDLTDCILYQNIHAEKGIAYWKGRTITFSCWVYATVADRVRLHIYDGVGTGWSSYHTGNSTWQLLSVTRTIDANATSVRITGEVSNANTSGYFDGAMCVEGSYAMAYAPSYKNTIRKYVLGATAFKSYLSSYGWAIEADGARLYNVSGELNEVTYLATVNLPNGAIVTSFKVYYDVNDTAATGSASLLRVTPTGTSSSLSDITFIVSSEANVGTEDTSIDNATIDNNSYSYGVSIKLNPNDSNSDIGFYSAVITYTSPQPLP